MNKLRKALGSAVAAAVVALLVSAHGASALTLGNSDNGAQIVVGDSIVASAAASAGFNVTFVSLDLNGLNGLSGPYDDWISRLLAGVKVPTPVVVAMPTAAPIPQPPAPQPPTAPPTAAPAPAAGQFTAEQQYTLQLHNQARAAAGVPALVLDSAINTAATRNAQDMATQGYFAHVSPQGKQPWDWMREAGVVFHAAGQNIGMDPSGASSTNASIKRLFDMMMAETPPNDGHRVNILSATYHRLGVGTATSGGKLYWVCDFAD